MESLLNIDQSQVKASTFKYNLQKLYQSYYIQAIYIILILLTLASFIWIIINQNNHRNSYTEPHWIIILEVLICAVVLLDLLVRIYLTGFCLFMHSVMNIIDLVMTVFCVIEIVIALFDAFMKEFNTIFTFVVLIIRNCLMMIRIFILMRRTIASRKTKELKIVNEVVNETVSEKSLDTILEGNRDYIRVVYRARLDTLGEEDEIFEDSLNQKHSVWRGRVKHGMDVEDLPSDK